MSVYKGLLCPATFGTSWQNLEQSYTIPFSTQSFFATAIQWCSSALPPSFSARMGASLKVQPFFGHYFFLINQKHVARINEYPAAALRNSAERFKTRFFYMAASFSQR